MPFSAVSLCFWVTVVESAVITSHSIGQEVCSLSRMMLKQLCHMSVFVFIHKQAGSPVGTTFPIFQCCYCLLHGMVSYTKLYCNFPVTHWSSLMNATTLCSLCSVIAVLPLPQLCWSGVSMFPSWKLFTFWHWWHPCRHLYMHDQVIHRSLLPFCHVGL